MIHVHDKLHQNLIISTCSQLDGKDLHLYTITVVPLPMAMQGRPKVYLNEVIMSPLQGEIKWFNGGFRYFLILINY